MTPVQITGSLPVAIGLGQSAVGKIRVSNPSFTTPSGDFVPAGQSFVSIAANGAYDFTLLPTTEAVGGQVTYTATYFLAASPQSFTEHWVVPADATGPLSIAKIRINQTVPAFPFAVQAAQIFSPTANIGDVLAFSGSGGFVPISLQSLHLFEFDNEQIFTITPDQHGQGSGGLLIRVFDIDGNELDPAVRVSHTTGTVDIFFGQPASGWGFISGGISRTLPNPSHTFINKEVIQIPRSLHRFGTRNLVVDVYDAAGFRMDGVVQKQIDSDFQVIVTLSSPKSGTVVIVGCLGTATTQNISSGSGTDEVPYITSRIAEEVVSIPAATHQKGLYAVAYAFTDDEPSVAVSFDYTRAADGSLVLSFSPAFTGTIQVQ